MMENAKNVIENSFLKLPLLRKTVSIVLLFTGIVMIISSVVIFIAPPNHVAYFSDWELWNLKRDQWNSDHVNIGNLFILFSSFSRNFP